MKYTRISFMISQVLLIPVFPVIANTNITALDEVSVIADVETESFKKIGAVSNRGAEKRMQSLDSVVRAIPRYLY